mgnify:CR=1 FL=1
MLIFRKSPLFGLFFLLTVSISYAQNYELKFGSIPDDLVSMKTYDADPNAEAVVLSHVGSAKIEFNATDGFVIKYRIHKVIKIISKEGISYADEQIPFYTIQGRKDNVFDIKGFVYNASGGVIQKEKLGKEHIFDEAVSKTYSLRKISFPNVKEGSVIEYTYQITSDLFSYLREWEFQSGIPTRWSAYTLEYPEYFAFSQTNQGYVPYFKTQQTQGTGTASWQDKTRSGQYTTTTTITNSNVNYTTSIYNWAVKDAPALRVEPFADNPNSYATKVEFQLQYIQFPNSQRQNIAQSWAKIADELLVDEDFGKHLEKAKFAKSYVPALISNVETEEQKLLQVVSFLHKKMSWDGRRGIYPTKSLEKSFETGKGSQADLNFVLISFLREAGFEAHPVIGTTRGRGFVNPSNPVMYKLNSLSALVKVGGKEMILDMSDPDLPIGFLPFEMINMQGLAIMPYQGSKWVDLANAQPVSFNSLCNYRLEDGQLVASFKNSYSGYSSVMMKKQVVAGPEKRKEEFLANNQDVTIIELDWENIDDKEKNIIEKGEIKYGEGFSEAGSLIYLNFFEKDNLAENPLKLENRVLPIDYVYPQRKQTVLFFEVPEGYVVEELPKGAVIQFQEKAVSFTYRVNYNETDRKIQILVNYQVNQTVMPSTAYAELRMLYDTISQKLKENIVIRKV